MNGPQLQPLALGELQHPRLAMLLRGNVPTRVEAFPERVFFLSRATLPKALWIDYRNLRSAKDLYYLQRSLFK
jgi:hypothetical protein